MKSRICIAVAILLAMWAVARFAVAPDAPDGINPLIDRQWSLANWLDVNFLTTAHRPEGGLGTITMVGNAMLGMFAGDILRGAASGMGRIWRLLAYAAMLASSGLLMAFAFGEYSLPVNKSIWSSSFALVTAAISSTLLAVFYWMVDVKGWRRWGFFFKVIGMNAITVYLLMRTVFNTPFALDYFFSGLYKVMPPLVADFFAQAGLIAIVWTLLLFLYRHKIFLRV
jgi:predicted acyltransferase